MSNNLVSTMCIKDKGGEATMSVSRSGFIMPGRVPNLQQVELVVMDFVCISGHLRFLRLKEIQNLVFISLATGVSANKHQTWS